MRVCAVIKARHWKKALQKPRSSIIALKLKKRERERKEYRLRATHGGYVGGGEHQPGESLKDNLAERCKTLSLAASVTQTVECTAEI